MPLPQKGAAAAAAAAAAASVVTPAGAPSSSGSEAQHFAPLPTLSQTDGCVEAASLADLFASPNLRAATSSSSEEMSGVIAVFDDNQVGSCGPGVCAWMVLLGILFVGYKPQKRQDVSLCL